MSICNKSLCTANCQQQYPINTKHSAHNFSRKFGILSNRVYSIDVLLKPRRTSQTMNRSRDRQENSSVSSSLDESEHELNDGGPLLTLPRHLRPTTVTSSKDRKSKSTKTEKNRKSKKKVKADMPTQSFRSLSLHEASASKTKYPPSPVRPSRSLTPPKQKLPGPRELLLTRSVSESDITVAWSNVSKPKETVLSKMLADIEIGTPGIPSTKRTSSVKCVTAEDKRKKGGKAKGRTESSRYDLDSLMERSMKTVSKSGSSSSRLSVPVSSSLHRTPSVNGKHTTLIFTSPKK